MTIHVGQGIALVDQQCRQFGTVVGPDGPKAAPRRRDSAGVEAVRTGSVHRNRLNRVVGLSGVVVGPKQPMPDNLGNGNGFIRLGVIASLLECALGGIDIGDRVHILDIQVMNRVALDDDRVDLWGMEADGIKIRIGDIDIMELWTSAVVQEIHGALHGGDIGTAHTDYRQPLK